MTPESHQPSPINSAERGVDPYPSQGGEAPTLVPTAADVAAFAPVVEQPNQEIVPDKHQVLVNPIPLAARQANEVHNPFETSSNLPSVERQPLPDIPVLAANSNPTEALDTTGEHSQTMPTVESNPPTKAQTIEDQAL